MIWTRLKVDIAEYRQQANGIRFELLHRFSEGEYVASRWAAHATDLVSGVGLSANGLNISRWRDGLLAEEWAVWEPLAAQLESTG